MNVGDLLQIFSNGLFPATLHRVVIPEEEKIRNSAKDKRANPRQSIVFFLHPDGETLCQPLDEDLLVKDMKYKPITAEDHVKRRFAETYQK